MLVKQDQLIDFLRHHVKYALTLAPNCNEIRITMPNPTCFYEVREAMHRYLGLTRHNSHSNDLQLVFSRDDIEILVSIPSMEVPLAPVAKNKILFQPISTREIYDIFGAELAPDVHINRLEREVARLMYENDHLRTLNNNPERHEALKSHLSFTQVSSPHIQLLLPVEHEVNSWTSKVINSRDSVARNAERLGS